MKSLIRSTLFLVAITCTLIPAVTASVEDGFPLLYNNQVEEARKIFQSELKDSPGAALAGLFLSAWTQGDDPEMARTLAQWIDTAAAEPELPFLLAFLGNSEFHGWTPAERVTLFRKLLERDLPPYNRQQLQVELQEALDMLLDSSVETAARAGGALLEHWALLGPFGRFGAPDIEEPFGPETGWKATYAGWQREVQWVTSNAMDKTGMIDYESQLGPVNGIAYALNQVESSADGEALLTIQSPSNYRVWLDGRPILEKSSYKMHTSQASTVRVPIKKGKQLMALKLQNQNTGWFRAYLQPISDSTVELHSVPFVWSEHSGLFLHPFSGEEFDNEEGYGLASALPPTPLVAGATEEQVIHRLLTAMWHEDHGEVSAALDSVRQALALTPKFSLLYSTYGDLSLRLAMMRPGSKARFQQEAESAFRSALDLDPLSRTALVGLQTYFLDRDQVDPALDLLNEQIKAHPELYSQGYSGLLDYGYGILYSRKNFAVESGQMFQKAVETYIPSYEAYRYLFDHYERSQQMPPALAVLQKALDIFPGFIPYLERANNFPASYPNAPDVEPLLRRALEIHPNSILYASTLYNWLVKHGKIQEAAEFCQNNKARFPYHTFWNEKQAELALVQGNRDEAVKNYQVVYEKHPRLLEPFRALRSLAGQKFPYQKYDVNLEDIDLSQAEKWKTSRASVIYLLDIMVLDLHEDGTNDMYVHQALQILNQEGLQKWAEIVIPKGGNVELLMARTITPDGKEWALSNLQDLNNQQSLSMYGIEPMSIVEYSYIQRGGADNPGANYHAGGYFFGSDDDPMLLTKLAIVKPDSIALQYDINPDTYPVKISHEGNNTIYEWQNEKQDGLKGEAYAPPLTERVPSIKWTTEPDWRNFIQRQRFSVWGFEERSPLVDAKAAELKGISSSTQEFVAHVYDYVREKIGDSSGGLTTADTLALQTGGRYQKMRLMRHLLKKGGVKTQLAVALENDLQDGYRVLPSLGYPAQALLAIPRQPGIEETLYADFSSRFAPLGDLNPSLHRAVALYIDGPVPYFEPVDSDFWEAGLLLRDFHLTLQDDRGADIQGTYTYADMYDKAIREALTNPEFERQFADRQLAAELNGIQIGSHEFQDIDNLTLPPRLAFSGKLPDVAKADEGQSLTLVPILARSKASEMIGDPTRQYAIEFQNSPVRDPLSTRLNLDTYIKQGAVISLPEDVLTINEFGYYSLFYSWEGNEIAVQRSFLVPEQTIEPDRYEEWMKFCREIDQMENRPIRIQLPSS